MSNEKFLLAVILPIIIFVVVAAAGVSVYFGVFFDKKQDVVVGPVGPVDPTPENPVDEYYFEYSDEVIYESMKLSPIDDENGLQLGWRIDEVVVPNSIVSDASKKLENISAENRGELGDFYEIPLAFPKTYQNKPILEIGGAFSKISAENKAKISLVHIPDSVVLLDGTFEGFSSLRSLSFDAGDGVETLGAQTFKNCTALAKIQFAKLVSAGERAFENCSSLENFEVGESFESVGEFCFYNCTKITDSKLFQSAIYFEDFCFAGTGFSRFDFGKNVNKIGAFLFLDCGKLSVISFDGDTDWTKVSRNLNAFSLPDKNVEIDILGWSKNQTSKALSFLIQQNYRSQYDVKIQTGSISDSRYFKSLTYMQ